LIFYDGIYRLQRKSGSVSQDTDKYSCAWRIRIIDFALSRPDVRHIRPIAVVITYVDEFLFKTNCAESMGRRICRDFNLDAGKLLWVEQDPDDSTNMYVASFKPKPYFCFEKYYYVDWRPILGNELDAIQPFI